MSEREHPEMTIGGRPIGRDHPVYVIAELSANHGGSLDRAIELIHLAAQHGADAVKLQTYTADTMTLPLDHPPFTIGPGTPWEGRQLYELYEEAATPWSWHAGLFDEAAAAGIHCFSTPFDATAVDFLEELRVPAYKVASFELLDLDLIARIAATGRPMLISTGMATAEEIDAAVRVARAADAQVALLRCNSAYPAQPREMDLRTINDMAERWDAVIGLSDHTLSPTAAMTAVALGASVLEKHLTWSRSDPGPDSSFSLEPAELGSLVTQIREVEASLGDVRYGPSPSERPSLAFRRSLWFVRDLPVGTVVESEHVAALRPSGGLLPSDRHRVVGRTLVAPVHRGDPVRVDLVGIDLADGAAP